MGANVLKKIKAETRCDKSRRHVASSALPLRQVACSYFIAAICRTNSNQFEFVHQIAATKFCRSDDDFHMSHEAICCSNVSQRVVASCVSALRGKFKSKKTFDVNFKTEI